MIKVLITGSNGFIGQELLYQAISSADIEPTALSRGENRYSVNQGYRYISADICDSEDLESLIQKHKPDCLIHTVAWANVEQCEREPDLCFKINTQPLHSLVELAAKYNFHLIYLSTDFVFDGKSGPYTETDLPMPLNVYGKSKLEAEKILIASSCKWTIVRTILVYGVPRDRNRSNFVLWVKKSLEGNKRIQVVTDHIRMPTLVNDLAEVCLNLARTGTTGMFHISGEESFTINEIAHRVAQFWRLDETLIQEVRSSDLASSVDRPGYTGFDISKAKNSLSFKPHSLAQGFEIMNTSV